MVLALCVVVSDGVREPAVAGGAERELEQVAPVGSPGREVVELRSRTSRTYEGRDGLLVARVFSGAVNFRADDGSWRAIDNRLVPEGEGYRNVANAYEAVLPESLAAGPVRVSEGSEAVSFRLRGASEAPAVVDGSTARYADALEGVDVKLTATADALKEEIVLADADAGRSLVFDLQVGDGLTPRLTRSGEVRVEDSRGRAELLMPAPFMFDAAGGDRQPVATELAREGDGWVLRLSPDREWLEAPGRSWPVTVDPGVYPLPTRDCFIEDKDGARESSFCGDGSIEVGYGAAMGARVRSIHEFPCVLCPSPKRAVDEGYMRSP